MDDPIDTQYEGHTSSVNKFSYDVILPKKFLNCDVNTDSMVLLARLFKIFSRIDATFLHCDENGAIDDDRDTDVLFILDMYSSLNLDLSALS